jgi:hypothetical protein
MNIELFRGVILFRYINIAYTLQVSVKDHALPLLPSAGRPR